MLRTRKAEDFVKNKFGAMSLFIVLVACAPAAKAQIISTSLPTLGTGETKLPISAHFMVSPLGSWDYKEGWFSDKRSSNYDEYFVGTVGKTSTSQILAAGEAAIPIGDNRLTATVGGWYNRIGDVDYNFDGQFLVIYDPSVVFLDYSIPMKATIPITVTMVEGHAGLFYRNYGVQVGVVRSQLKSDGNIVALRREDGAPQADLEGYFPFDASTTDVTLYGVYKRSVDRAAVSAGFGIYRKQGIKSASDSPLRFADSKMVASGFLTASVELKHRFSLDASYWFIGKTDQAKDIKGYTSTTPSDSQSRLTVGVGYSL
ncbi:MAG: hypothetical protein AAB011_09610 [Candidatus Eisenbacteria bacterium]